jgi:hypothetical protein
MEAKHTKLYSLEIDLEAPLSHLDWTQFVFVVLETKGLGWFQILPEKCKSSTPLQFNLIHVIPQSQIPFAKLPLDFLIAQKEKFIGKQQKQKSRTLQPGYVEHKPVHSRDAEALDKGMILIDEFTFPHCVFKLASNEQNTDGFKYGFQKMAQFLRVDKNKNLGMTVVITPSWMFMALIEKPYHYENLMDIPGANSENGVPVFLDGFAYNGVLNVQPVV